jgi:hypothetical protein
MLPEAAQYRDSFKTLHSQLLKHLDGLPPAALDWVPTPGANSLTVLVAHAVGAERFLVAQTVGGADVHRDRDAEFRARGLDGRALIALVETADIETAALLVAG